MDLRERPDSTFLRHPWETARSRFFSGLLRCAGDGPRRILDVGAGDGWLASELAARHPGARVWCWDARYTPELIAELGPAAPPGVSLEASRPDGRFDWVLLLDVLEHVEHDRGFLESLVRESLASQGRVLLSVPAWPCLFGSQDRALGHFRRYTRGSFRALLAAAGLRPLRSGGLFHALVPLRLLAVWRDRLRGEPAARGDSHLEWSHGPVSARWVHRLLVLDAALGGAASRLRVDLPGLSCWALCERSG